MKKIDVFYEGWGEHWQLGTLADNGRQLLFEYSTNALQHGLQLSPMHLPLQAAAFGDFPSHQMRLPGLVADALPDGWGLLLMDRLFRQQGRDAASVSPLDRLAFIGERAMGALSFAPAQDVALTPHDVQLLGLAQDAKAAVHDQDCPALKELALMGGSPHGARPKVLVHYAAQTGRLGTLPFEGAQPWLVKFQAQGEHKEVCAIEVLYADMARVCGLDMPATRYFDLDKNLAAFAIARFDVEQGLRVPVHTLAGLLHANFRLPSAVDYGTFLRATRFLTGSQAEVDKAFARAVFNVVFHNRDDHAKNFSYRLGVDHNWYLAPAYDLTFCEGPGGEHQMDVCGEGRAITKSHLLQLAKIGGITPVAAQALMDRVLDHAGRFATQAANYPIRAATRKRIAACIAANSARLG